MIEPPNPMTELINGVKAAIELPCFADRNDFGNLTLYDGVEVHPVSWNPENGDCETCERDDPELAMWSVYLHIVPTVTEGGVQCIADFATEEEAIAFAQGICWLQGWEL